MGRRDLIGTGPSSDTASPARNPCHVDESGKMGDVSLHQKSTYGKSQ
jgi:hypothetical protein